jgi:hypothetical protein
MKDSFYEELERIFDKFPKYHMKNLLGDFNVEVGKEDIFKQATGNESLHEINNGNGIRTVRSATSKNMTVKSTLFHNVIFINLLEHLLLQTLTIRLAIF